MLSTAQLSDALYRTVLTHWRRSHAESVVLSGELRTVEHDNRAHALLRLLRSRRGSALQKALRLWELHASHIARVQAIRLEKSASRELEAALELAREDERAVREQWDLDRQQWLRREQEDLALAEALQGDATAVIREAPHAPAAAFLPPPPPPPAPPPPPSSAIVPSAVDDPALLSLPAAGPRLGSRASGLLAAWRRESTAAG